jgi:hypothetical protein
VLRCLECGREPGWSENPIDEWRCYSDGVGELLLVCPQCAAREFGSRTVAIRRFYRWRDESDGPTALA